MICAAAGRCGETSSKVSGPRLCAERQNHRPKERKAFHGLSPFGRFGGSIMGQSISTSMFP